MFLGIMIIPRMSFSKARDRLIRLGLTPHEAVWVLLHGDGEQNSFAGYPACNGFEAALAKEKGGDHAWVNNCHD